jgi:hypothetical protein
MCALDYGPKNCLRYSEPPICAACAESFLLLLLLLYVCFTIHAAGITVAVEGRCSHRPTLLADVPVFKVSDQ